MVRPCFLVIDREFSGSISTRKLVIETAKFNVITAYSSLEAISTLQLYPAVNGVVLDVGMPDMPCSALIAALRQIAPEIVIVAISRPYSKGCEGADHSLDSFDPKNLLALLQKLEPEQTAAIQEQQERLIATE